MKNSLGIILIVIGLVVAIWGGMGFTRKEKVIDVGPIEATRDKTTHVPYAPIAGAVIAIGGVALVIAGRK